MLLGVMKFLADLSVTKAVSFLYLYREAIATTYIEKQ